MESKEWTVRPCYQGLVGVFLFVISLDFLLHSDEWGTEGAGLFIVFLLVFGLVNMLYGFIRTFRPELHFHIDWVVPPSSGNEYERAVMREVMGWLGEPTPLGKDDKPKRNT